MPPSRFHAAMGLTHHRDGNGVLWVTFTPEGHRPPLLTSAVMESLREVVHTVQTDPAAGLIFCAEPGGDFQAGVDLDEMKEIPSQQDAFRRSREVQLLFQRVADLPVPSLAVIEGRCLGGGTELSLACSARMAADHPDTAIALPEIHLGIIPGFGGTQRLPRLIGQRRALDMILTGRAVGATDALKIGLVDHISPSDELRGAASAFLNEMIEGRFRAAGPGLWWRPWELVFEGLGFGRRAVRNRYRRAVIDRT